MCTAGTEFLEEEFRARLSCFPGLGQIDKTSHQKPGNVTISMLIKERTSSQRPRAYYSSILGRNGAEFDGKPMQNVTALMETGT